MAEISEIWKPIRGYKGLYEVSNFGNVRNQLGELKKFHRHQKGYLIVCLWKDNKKKNKRVHRLVARAFVENDRGLNEINHIDGEKENNCAYNLEWCTHKENMQHYHSCLK